MFVCGGFRGIGVYLGVVEGMSFWFVELGKVDFLGFGVERLFRFFFLFCWKNSSSFCFFSFVFVRYFFLLFLINLNYSVWFCIYKFEVEFLLGLLGRWRREVEKK